MSLISKLRPRKSSAAKLAAVGAAALKQEHELSIDAMFGDPAAHLLTQWMDNDDWRTLRSFLASVPNHDDRAFYITAVLGIQDGLPAWLDEWIAEEPGSAMPWLLRGVRGTQWAWAARGAGRGSSVSPEAYHLFRARLIEADRDLLTAASLDASDPLPYAQMLVTARGLHLGYNALRTRFGEAVARDPLNYRAHANMLQGMARKWGGSHELMYDFARSAVATAPRGHRLHTLIAEAHIEGWVDGDRAHRHLYWKVPGIRAEIHHAAARSVERPEFDAGGETAADRNVFAFCFWSFDEPEALREQLDRIGDHPTRLPWAYVGEPTTIFTAARRYAAEPGRVD